MKSRKAAIATLVFSVLSLACPKLLPICFAWAPGQTGPPAQNPAQPAIARSVGAIKAINGSAIILAPATGPEVTVNVQPSARILRIASGEKDLKNATPLQLQELQVGDTIRARGQASDDGKSIAALEIIVITSSAVQAVGEQIRQDWQKRGIGGIVAAVDDAAGTVTISISSFGGKKTVVVHASKSTLIHRYAPDSFKSEDAKLSTLKDVHVDDQLRARGDRSADGSELTAEEIYAGSFPNVEGLIKTIDASTGTISVQDVLSKKTVQLKITADSQLHKIPAEMAQRFANRVKAALPPGIPGAPMNSSGGAAPTGQESGGRPAASGAPPGGTASSGGMPNGGVPGGNRAGGGGFDFQRLLDQTPAVALADLHKGDAIVVLATEGTPTGGSTVIKLFSGVEPILQAAPSGSQAMMLAPWSLGGAPGGDAGP
jgi:hypothetical protein